MKYFDKNAVLVVDNDRANNLSKYEVLKEKRFAQAVEDADWRYFAPEVV